MCLEFESECKEVCHHLILLIDMTHTNLQVWDNNMLNIPLHLLGSH